MTQEASLTPTDVRLLAALAGTRNVVHAAREIGIPRDRAVYRLGRLARLYGTVIRAERGGTDGGSTTLTALGRRLLAEARGSRTEANQWVGTYRRRPSPTVALDDGSRLDVTFSARDGAAVTVELDPEAIVVSPREVSLSARNALQASVVAFRSRAGGTVEMTARWRNRPVRVALTRGSVRRLGLTAGRDVYLYVKATAVRRVGTAPDGARPTRLGPLRSRARRPPRPRGGSASR